MGLHLSKADEEILYIPPRKRRVQHKEKPRPATLRSVQRRAPNNEPPAGPRKVMTQRELSLWLESMGFPKETVNECLQKIQFGGNRTIVDANQLVEQLLQHAPRTQTSSPLRRSNRLLRNSRNLSPSSASSSSSSSSSSTSALSSSNPSDTTISNFPSTSPINTTSPFAASPISTINPTFSSPALTNSPCRSMNCKICFERQIDTVILRCGHVCVCSKCTPQLKVCPICRQDIVEIVKIYHV